MSPRLLAWGRMMLLFAAGFGAAAQFARISMLFPAWSAAYPEAGAGLGFLLSVISLMGVVLGLVAGMAVARTGLRRMLVWALALGAVLSAVQALLPPLPVMLVLRGAEGLSHLAIVVAAPTLMAEIAPARSRSLAMSIWSTYFGVAFLLFGLAGPGLLALGGLGAVQLGHAGWMAMMAVVLRVCLPADRVVPGRFPFAGLGRRHLAAYSSPFIAAPGVGWLFYTLTYVAYLTVLPPFLPEASRLLLLALLPITGIVVSLTLGAALLRVIPAVSLAIGGFVLAGLSVLAMGLLPGSAVPPVVLFVAMGFMQSGSFAAVPQINHSAEDRALSNGAMAQLGNLGNLLGTPVLLALTQWLGAPGLILFGLVAYTGGATVHVWAARMRARAAATAGPG